MPHPTKSIVGSKDKSGGKNGNLVEEINLEDINSIENQSSFIKQMDSLNSFKNSKKPLLISSLTSFSSLTGVDMAKSAASTAIDGLRQQFNVITSQMEENDLPSADSSRSISIASTPMWSPTDSPIQSPTRNILSINTLNVEPITEETSDNHSNDSSVINIPEPTISRTPTPPSETYTHEDEIIGTNDSSLPINLENNLDISDVEIEKSEPMSLECQALFDNLVKSIPNNTKIDAYLKGEEVSLLSPIDLHYNHNDICENSSNKLAENSSIHSNQSLQQYDQTDYEDAMLERRYLRRALHEAICRRSYKFHKKQHVIIKSKSLDIFKDTIDIFNEEHNNKYKFKPSHNNNVPNKNQTYDEITLYSNSDEDYSYGKLKDSLHFEQFEDFKYTFNKMNNDYIIGSKFLDNSDAKSFVTFSVPTTLRGRTYSNYVGLDTSSMAPIHSRKLNSKDSIEDEIKNKRNKNMLTLKTIIANSAWDEHFTNFAVKEAKEISARRNAAGYNDNDSIFESIVSPSDAKSPSIIEFSDIKPVNLDSDDVVVRKRPDGKLVLINKESIRSKSHSSERSSSDNSCNEIVKQEYLNPNKKLPTTSAKYILSPHGIQRVVDETTDSSLSECNENDISNRTVRKYATFPNKEFDQASVSGSSMRTLQRFNKDANDQELSDIVHKPPPGSLASQLVAMTDKSSIKSFKRASSPAASVSTTDIYYTNKDSVKEGHDFDFENDLSILNDDDFVLTQIKSSLEDIQRHSSINNTDPIEPLLNVIKLHGLSQETLSYVKNREYWNLTEARLAIDNILMEQSLHSEEKVLTESQRMLNEKVFNINENLSEIQQIDFKDRTSPSQLNDHHKNKILGGRLEDEFDTMLISMKSNVSTPTKNNYNYVETLDVNVTFDHENISNDDDFLTYNDIYKEFSTAGEYLSSLFNVFKENTSSTIEKEKDLNMDTINVDTAKPPVELKLKSNNSDQSERPRMLARRESNNKNKSPLIAYNRQDSLDSMSTNSSNRLVEDLTKQAKKCGSLMENALNKVKRFGSHTMKRFPSTLTPEEQQYYSKSGNNKDIPGIISQSKDLHRSNTKKSSFQQDEDVDMHGEINVNALRM